MRAQSAAIGGMALAGALVAGCSLAADVSTAPTVAGNALQAEIADRLTKAGEHPESVTCGEDLIGEVGQTARCEVVMTPTNSFQPVVTVTGVDGGTIDYEMTPAVSREQLDTAVRRLVTAAGVTVDAVACESGLDGKIGAVAYCDVTVGGVAVRRTVAVNSVDGLMMNFDLQPV
jgi:hypothetical protein